MSLHLCLPFLLSKQNQICFQWHGIFAHPQIAIASCIKATYYYINLYSFARYRISVSIINQQSKIKHCWDILYSKLEYIVWTATLIYVLLAVPVRALSRHAFASSSAVTFDEMAFESITHGRKLLIFRWNNAYN